MVWEKNDWYCGDNTWVLSKIVCRSSSRIVKNVLQLLNLHILYTQYVVIEMCGKLSRKTRTPVYL